MARIRSIHPGIWTDEDFVEMSATARLFMLGLWNEADDYGVLEWRPTKLKMRLAPVDNIDAAAVMEEIEAAGFLVRIDRGGKTYAVIKNFRKWQRPKNPAKPLIPVDGEISGIIKLDEKGSPTPDVPQPSPSKGEIPPQREEGGGNRKGEEDDSAANAASSSSRYAFEHGVIRLLPKDLEKWREAYPMLHLEAELYQLSEWAGRDHPKNWFHAVSAALAKRNRQQAAAMEKARAEGAARGSPKRNLTDAAIDINRWIKPDAEPDTSRDQYALPSPDRW